MGNNSLLFESIFNRKLSEADTTAYLADITKEYPYFSPAQFFLLSKLDKKSAEYDKQVGKTALLFNNPYWLNFLLMEESTGTAIQENGFAKADKFEISREQLLTPPEQVTEQAHVYNNIEADNLNYLETAQGFIEENTAVNSQQPSFGLTPEISNNFEEIAELPLPIIEEPSSSPNIKENESEPAIEEPLSSFDLIENKELEATHALPQISAAIDDDMAIETEVDTYNEEELPSSVQEPVDFLAIEEEKDILLAVDDQSEPYVDVMETPATLIETKEKDAAPFPESSPVGFSESINEHSGDDKNATEIATVAEPEPTNNNGQFELPPAAEENALGDIGENAQIINEVAVGSEVVESKADNDQPKYSTHFNNDDTPLENEAETETSIQETTPLNFRLNIDTSNVTEETITFEPLHTSDYFASQGIKLSAEVQPSDKLGKQLKSFTEWLKTMKKIHSDQLSAQNGQVENSIQKLAENSNKQDEVLTESMAEVLIQQGKTTKAVEVYKKLSLLDTAKSAYFAAKIDQLNKH